MTELLTESTTRLDAPAAHRHRLAGLVLCAVALVVVCLLSVAVGAKSIPLATVIDAVFAYDPTNTDHLIVRSLRVPRTSSGCWSAPRSAAAGAVMQGLTRNPLADPGILGVNAGAALFVVIGIYSFGLTSLLGYVWFAFAGAAVASVVVYSLGSLGREGATPGQAGAGRRRAHGPARLDHHGDPARRRRHARPVPLLGRRVARRARRRRSPPASRRSSSSGCSWPWRAGRCSTPSPSATTWPAALGQRVGLSRAARRRVRSCCCAARPTAAAGPIAFVGLAVPHIARAITGPDYRWIMPVLDRARPGPARLAADIIGRVVARPGEVQVGIVTAVLGAPVFIALVRRRKMAEL